MTETTPKTDHVWDSKTGKCTVCDTACDHKDGDHTAFDSQTGKCKVCGYQCAHDFGEDNICKVCGFKKCTTHTKPVGSDAVIITVKAATCKTEGLVKYKCTVCGEEVTEKTAVDPDAHDWNSATGKCKLCDAECEHKDEHEKPSMVRTANVRFAVIPVSTVSKLLQRKVRMMLSSVKSAVIFVPMMKITGTYQRNRG